MGGMVNILTDLKKPFLDKFNKVDFKFNTDYRTRKMADRLWEEFDEVWVRYKNGDATRSEWDASLNKWLSVEKL